MSASTLYFQKRHCRHHIGDEWIADAECHNHSNYDFALGFQLERPSPTTWTNALRTSNKNKITGGIIIIIIETSE